MELEQLHQLEAIDRYGTMSSAAEHLHMSQPSLSRSIKRLESDLGQELFDRTGNSATFNEAGKLALEHAHAMLAEERRMRDAFDEFARRQRTIKVLSVAPVPTWRLTTLVVEQFPGTILDPELVEERQAESALVNQETDLAITLRPLQLPNMRSVPLMTEDLCLSAPAESSLAQRDTVTLAELDGKSFLVLEDIGFWMGVVREQLPHSQIIIQKDRNVFTQLVQSTDLLCFTTEAPENAVITKGRVNVAISDGAAHATFFLNARTDASNAIQQIMGAAAELM